MDHPLPGVELEDAAHRAALAVDEADVLVQAHLLDRHQLAGQARLARDLDHVADGHEVLARVLGVGVQRSTARSPGSRGSSSFQRWTSSSWTMFHWSPPAP